MSTAALFERFYYSRPGFIQGTPEFHAMIAAAVPSGARMLEIGSGPPNETTTFLASIGPVTGVDVSAEHVGNPALAAAHVFDGRTLPFPDGHFDACVSNYVLEHVEDPRVHFREVARVLRPGGTYLFRTPNLWHYVALASRLLPHAAHLALANRLRGHGDDAHDPWPTFYRANTRRAVRTFAASAGLRVGELRMVEKDPSYGAKGAIFFYPMMAWERVVNSSDAFAPVRANIFARLVKP
jgi:SAM-dependent methyltransferase